MNTANSIYASDGNEVVETKTEIDTSPPTFNPYKFYHECTPNDGNNNDVLKDRLLSPDSGLSPSLFDLSFLEGVSHFILKQNLHFLDIGVPYSDEALKYDIFDETGRRLMITAETSKSCKIFCCKTDRTFQFFVLDGIGRRILIVTRPCGLFCCLGVTCLGDMCCNEVKVTLGDGTLIGIVSQKFCFCKPIYILKNSIGEPNFRVAGPKCAFCCPCRICCATHFSILTPTLPPRVPGSKKKPKRIKLGEIKEDWIEFENPIFLEGDNFGASFPVNYDTQVKATILGAVILINFLHFHKDPCAPTQFCC